MKATVELDEGMRFVGAADTGFEVAMDAGRATGGNNGAARPMEVILIGLCGCTGMDVISILRKKRQEIMNLRVSASADRAKEHPKVFKSIHLEYVAYGQAINEKALKRSIDLSLDRYCPVNAMLSATVDISYSYRIEQVDV